MAAARPVRIARPRNLPPAAPPAPAPREPGAPVGASGQERRENSGATRRAWRLALLYTVGIAAVYGLLIGIAQAGPVAGSSGTSEALLTAGLLAAAVAVVGAVVALGAAPRAVEVGQGSTVVLGRFGGRYRFPALAELRVTVLARTPAGLLAPVPLETVEIAGGSTRRTFLIDEGLLAPAGPDGSAGAPA